MEGLTFFRVRLKTVKPPMSGIDSLQQGGRGGAEESPPALSPSDISTLTQPGFCLVPTCWAAGWAGPTGAYQHHSHTITLPDGRTD